MIIEITGRHGSITEGLKQHAKDRLDQALRHAPDLVSAHVILDSEKQRQMAEIIVGGPGLHATVHAESEDAYTSIDRCAEKLRHQLEKHHGKRKDRRRRGHSHEDRAEAERAAIENELARQAEEEAVAPPEPVRANVVLRSLDYAEAYALLPATDEGLVAYTDSASSRTCILFQREDGTPVVLEAEPEQA
jgi:putative sigma-54 modulation protein